MVHPNKKTKKFAETSFHVKPRPGTYIAGTESWHAERRDGEGLFDVL